MKKIPLDIQKLIDIYVKAQENLVKIIAEKEAKGSTAAYQKSLLKQVLQMLKNLDNEAKKWSENIIPNYYQQGIDEAIQGLQDLGQDVNINTGFSQIHQGAIQTIVNNCYGDLNDANNFIGRRIQDVIRQAGIDAVVNKIATGQTVKECKKNIVNALIDEGLNGIKDKRGRMISLDAYADIVARSITAEATNTATTNQLTLLGYDLVKMSSHLTTCPVCSAYQGRVYSISGKDDRFPRLDEIPGFRAGYSNIHPRCKHRVFPYIPDLADDLEGDIKNSNKSFDIDERSKKSIDEYDRQQKAKTQMRNDYNQWQRYSLSMPKEVPKTFAGFRRMKYSNSGKYDELASQYKSLTQGGEGVR